MLALALHFIALLFLIGCLGILGNSLLNRFKQNEYTPASQLFLSCLIGTVVFTTVIACYYTNFKSILLLFTPLFFYLILSRSEKSNTVLPVEKTSLRSFILAKGIALFCVLALLFGWYVRLVLDENFQLSVPANPENSLYAQFAKVIANTGVENTFGIGFLSNSSPPTLSPYHYFDLWFTAGISHLLDITELQAIHFYTLPLFNFIAVLGVLALGEIFFKLRYYHVFFALLLMGLCACYFFPGAEGFGRFQFDFTENTLSLYGEKLSVAFVFLLASLVLYLKKNRVNAILLLTLTAFLYPSFLLPFSLGIPAFCFLLLWKQTISLRTLLMLLLIHLSFLALYYLFYSFNGASGISLANASDYKGFNLGSFKLLFAELVYRSWAKPFRTILIYLPYVLVVLISLRKKQLQHQLSELLLLAGCLYLGSLLSWASFYKLPEAWQMYTNSLIFIHLVFIIFMLRDVFSLEPSLKSYLVKSAFCMLLITSLFFANKGLMLAKKQYSYSSEFLKAIDSLHLSSNEKFTVGYILSPEDCHYRMELISGGMTGSYLQREKNT
ncbi:MAG: hypothetical protein IPP32_17700 [Bacteroidetes bacterium]|nr:hypothetical protein [Bacteroidota bacterium]